MRNLIKSLRTFWRFLGELPMAAHHPAPPTFSEMEIHALRRIGPCYSKSVAVCAGRSPIGVSQIRGLASIGPGAGSVVDMQEWLRRRSAPPLKQ